MFSDDDDLHCIKLHGFEEDNRRHGYLKVDMYICVDGYVEVKLDKSRSYVLLLRLYCILFHGSFFFLNRLFHGSESTTRWL